MTLPRPSLPLPANPTIIELPAGYPLLRFYDPDQGPWHDHRFFGPLGEARFDHQPPPPARHPTRSVWYAGTSLRGAVAETFGKLGFVDLSCGRKIVKARVVGSIEVLDLVGTAARKLQLTQEIATTTDYGLCQTWARAFYDQYTGIEGIRWRGREIGSINVVFTDRAEMTRLAPAVDEEMTHPSIWPRLARAIRDCSLGII